MIKNDRQYQYTKNKLAEFKENIKEINKKYSSDKMKARLFSQGYSEQIAEMKSEITEYKNMKEGPLPKSLHAQDISEINHLLVWLRLANGMSQEDLAQKIGCKQSDVSRFEKEDYSGFTIGQLEKIIFFEQGIGWRQLDRQ